MGLCVSEQEPQILYCGKRREGGILTIAVKEGVQDLNLGSLWRDMAGKSPPPFIAALVAKVGPHVSSVTTVGSRPVEIVVGGDLANEFAGQVISVSALGGTEFPML